MSDQGFSRRTFLKGASIAAAVSGAAVAPDPRTGIARDEARKLEPGLHDLALSINGETRKLKVEPRTTLLDALRDQLDLTGAKKVCDRGACGGCTVLLDGEPVNACLTLAFDAEGHAIRTIEGLASGDTLHPVQEAFVHCDALQCGFCTPGFVMSAVACLEHHPAPSRERIREDLSGNICRCGTYGRIVEAVETAARQVGKTR
ncbi:MAG: (2Fe-2S)-binding protein [Planctomycetota bacterium]